MVRCVCSVLDFIPLISHLVYKTSVLEIHLIVITAIPFFTVLYSTPSFSYAPLSVTELITKMIGDWFQRQHESQKYQARGFLQDMYIFFVLERKSSLGRSDITLRNQLLSKYLQYYF